MNGDDSIQLTNSLGINRYIFSEKKNSDVKIKYSWNQRDLISVLYVKNIQIISKLIGNYNLYNIAAAITIGNYFQVPLKKIKKAIEEYVPNSYRSQIVEIKKIKIIMDCYNANPTSMKKSISYFNQIKGNKMAILGDMLELGFSSFKEHKKIVIELENSNINTVFLIGKIFFSITIKNSEKIKKFINKNIFKKWIQDYYSSSISNSTTHKIDLILIKGSRKNSLETLIDLI
ncbi:glutamate ligase domain-containing protein [Blattabacterium cuenoti]|uniref:glutamate ligase domain-containing protein n=1 Tax=Blattabacterium cuenoti TaxID=1653831 RepID=UPI0021D29725|nr:cyanophycin synthetase [Blattabacterium cuenoti]